MELAALSPRCFRSNARASSLEERCTLRPLMELQPLAAWRLGTGRGF